MFFHQLFILELLQFIHIEDWISTVKVWKYLLFVQSVHWRKNNLPFPGLYWSLPDTYLLFIPSKCVLSYWSKKLWIVSRCIFFVKAKCEQSVNGLFPVFFPSLYFEPERAALKSLERKNPGLYRLQVSLSLNDASCVWRAKQ